MNLFNLEAGDDDKLSQLNYGNRFLNINLHGQIRPKWYGQNRGPSIIDQKWPTHGQIMLKRLEVF